MLRKDVMEYFEDVISCMTDEELEYAIIHIQDLLSIELDEEE